MAKKLGPFIIVILFAFISVMPLLKSGLHPTHDGEYHIIRFWQFDKVLKEGEVFPRWAPDLNNGYGIPLFTYQYPLPNYIGAIFHSLGFSFIESSKYSLFLAGILGAIFMFILSRELFGNISGIVSAVLYAYAPYKLLNIYVRGSIGEVWALAVAPLLFWSILKSFETQGKRYLIASSVVYALLILSHNILGMLFFIFSILFTLVLHLGFKKKRYNFMLLSPALFGLGLSAFFWIPALFEKDFVKGLDVFDYKRHFPEVYELLLPSWGTGFSSEATGSQMSFQIGVVNLLIILFVVLLLLKRLLRNRKRDFLIYFFVTSFLVSVLMMNKISIFFWEVMPLISFLQFPWRFLSIIIFSCALIAGFVIVNIRSKFLRHTIATLIVCTSILITIQYTKPAYYHNRQDSHYLSRSNFTKGTNSVGNSFNTKWLDSIPVEEKNSNTYLVKLFENKNSKRKYVVSSSGERAFYPNISYFPGWKIYVNGAEQKNINRNGVLEAELDDGLNLIEIELLPTQIQNIANIIFVISFISIILWWLYPAIIKKW